MKPKCKQLIESLSKNEKRHVSLFLHTYKKNSKLVSLFNLMSSQKVEKQESIFLKKNEALVSYLYKLILKAMRNYEFTHKSVEQKIKENAANAEVLLKKNLTLHAIKFVKKAEALCEFTDRFDLTYEVDEIKKATQKKLGLSYMKELYGDTQKQIKKIETLLLLTKIKALNEELVITNNRIGTPRNKQQTHKYRILVARAEEIIKSKKEIPLSGKLDLYNIFNTYNYIIGDYKSLNSNLTKLIDVFEDNEILKKINSEQYLVKLNNLIIDCVYFKNYSLAKRYLKIMQSLELPNQELEIKKMGMLYSLKLGICIYDKSFQTYINETEINTIEKNIERHRKKISENHLISIQYYLCVYYFVIAKYKNALRWNNAVIDTKEDIRNDLHSYARILNLLIHFELKNSEQLAYYLIAAKRYLQKNKALYAFEFMFLSQLEKLNRKDIDEKKHHSFFASMLNKLIKLIDDNYEMKALEYFDFIAWIKSKIEGKSLIDFYKLKQLND